MAKICASEKTTARQRWIEQGLLELMQERSFEEITVTDLCRYLELSRRSFYRYFRDMEDVLDCLMSHTFQDMVIVDSPLTIPALQTYYEFWQWQKPLLNALAFSKMRGKITEYAMSYADEETLKKHLAVDDLGMDISREVNLFVITGLSSLLIAWHEEGFQKTPEQMARITHRMLSKPVMVPVQK